MSKFKSYTTCFAKYFVGCNNKLSQCRTYIFMLRYRILLAIIEALNSGLFHNSFGLNKKKKKHFYLPQICVTFMRLKQCMDKLHFWKFYSAVLVTLCAS